MATVFLHGQSGKALPDLSNPANATDIISGKDAIDQNGEKVTGTYVPLDTSDATAEAADILRGETAYVNGQKVTGTMANNSGVEKGGIYKDDAEVGCQPHDTGANYLKIYTKANFTGYVDNTTKIVTFIQNLTASVIRAGQVCGPAGGLQVTGTYTSDATAAAGDIVSGKTAYVNGSKLTGTLEKITCVHGVPSILKSYPYTITVELPKSPKMIVFWKYIESDPDVANIQGFFMPELFGTSKMTYRLFSDDEFTSRAITISTSSTSFILSCNQTNNGAAAIWANNYYAVY